jgi:hypothetical protein
MGVKKLKCSLGINNIAPHRYYCFYPSFKVSKMSSRPTRSCRATKSAPILPEIVSKINDLNGKYYENIRNEFNATVKYFNEDDTKITDFWLTNYEYNLLDFKHQFLIRCLLSQVGLKQEKVVEFLNKIDDTSLLLKLGTIRVQNGTSHFYRIHVGINT